MALLICHCLLQVLQISENKQALLTEAQHHHHPGQQHGQHDDHTAAAAGADEADPSGQDKDLPSPTAAAKPVGVSSTPRKRRRSSRVSLVVPPAGDHDDVMGGTAADTAAAATTLQSLAPKKEQLGRDDVVGLMAAVMKQAGQQ